MKQDLTHRLTRSAGFGPRMLIATLLCSCMLVGCPRVDTAWHRYQGRSAEVIGSDRNLVETPSDGWRIIGKIDDSSKAPYEWGWEVTISAGDISPERKNIPINGKKFTLLLTIKEIHYILLDEDGFELAKDILRDQSMDYGTIETFRHTSSIPEAKAARAARSVFRIVLL